VPSSLAYSEHTNTPTGLLVGGGLTPFPGSPTYHDIARLFFYPQIPVSSLDSLSYPVTSCLSPNTSADRTATPIQDLPSNLQLTDLDLNTPSEGFQGLYSTATPGLRHSSVYRHIGIETNNPRYGLQMPLTANYLELTEGAMAVPPSRGIRFPTKYTLNQRNAWGNQTTG
jgi:hypothetical protein